MSKPKDNNPSQGGLIRLTARCTAADCAGKLGPADLSAVLARLDLPSHPDLLVGISTGDDAGVLRLSDDLAIVNTIDFFTPVVDDPFTYGQISAAGALSGVYAMGGLPRTALNIVCWPQTGLPNEMLAEILRGAAEKAREAGVVIVGGHTVANENEEVKFGMAVTGVIDPHRIVRNVGARAGDALVLTKALGTGILMTAFKRDHLTDEPYQAAVRSMTQLNAAAASAMLKYDVHAATAIMGFGLVGHALKMAEGSAVTIVFEESDLPLLPGVLEQCRAGMIPGGGQRNREYYAPSVRISDEVSDEIAAIAFDPQTSGGLLIAIPDQQSLALLAELHNCGHRDAAIVGRVTPRREHPIELV
ncbi:selenide, water dikinase SelD [Candidatus Binatus sp.]|uniref:selenide, water dikinase SelD n=1 Tax=Candidatus Binatus sp. TaxID=2811406 RepID=UPI002F94CF9E